MCLVCPWNNPHGHAAGRWANPQGHWRSFPAKRSAPVQGEAKNDDDNDRFAMDFCCLSNFHESKAALGSPHEGGPFVPLADTVCQAHWQKLKSHPGRCLERFKNVENESFTNALCCHYTSHMHPYATIPPTSPTCEFKVHISM